jgi:hypothetical protein
VLVTDERVALAVNADELIVSGPLSTAMAPPSELDEPLTPVEMTAVLSANVVWSTDASPSMNTAPPSAITAPSP